MAGAGHADAIIANPKGYLDRGFEIFLFAHYGPETREDVQTKIDYLEGLKSIAGECTTADEFKQKVNEKYPGYSGANYLDMTAGFFFPQLIPWGTAGPRAGGNDFILACCRRRRRA